MGENAVWLATPLSVGLLSARIRRLADPTVRRTLSLAASLFVLVFLLADGWHIAHNAYFDEGSRLDKTVRVNHPLATTYTNARYASATDSVLAALQSYVKPGDYLFCFQSRPMLHYLTHTRPYMHNPWPWSYDTASMELNLQRAEARGGDLPVIVREKGRLIIFTDYDPDWDNTRATDTFEHKNRKIQLIQDFICRHHYRVVWESETFQILVPESMHN